MVFLRCPDQGDRNGSFTVVESMDLKREKFLEPLKYYHNRLINIPMGKPYIQF